MNRKIATIIKDIPGDCVIIGEEELKHALEEHFSILPVNMLLEFIERILKDPSRIFEEVKLNEYHLFYRLDNGRYLLVIVKKTPTGNYFSSMLSPKKL